jgi:hypothetical protein
MDVPSVKGVLLRGAVERIQSYLASGRLSREQLEFRLGPEDAALLEKDAIVNGLWYPATRYERLLDLIREQEGRRDAALVAFGREAAESLLSAPAFTGIFEATARRKGHETGGPLLMKLTELMLNFSRWKYVGVSADEFRVEVSQAVDFHEHARHAAQGMIEFFASRLFETRLCMTSQRPSRDRILFRGTRAG